MKLFLLVFLIFCLSCSSNAWRSDGSGFLIFDVYFVNESRRLDTLVKLESGGIERYISSEKPIQELAAGIYEVTHVAANMEYQAISNTFYNGKGYELDEKSRIKFVVEPNKINYLGLITLKRIPESRTAAEISLGAGGGLMARSCLYSPELFSEYRVRLAQIENVEESNFYYDCSTNKK